MDTKCNLAEAKNRFSELINLVLPKGKQGKFKDFLLSGPSLAGVDLKRDNSLVRDVIYKNLDSANKKIGG